MKRKSYRALIIALIMMATMVFSLAQVSAATKKPWMPQNFTAHPGYKSVILQWKSSQQKILGYRVWKSNDNGKTWGVYKTLYLKNYPGLRNVKTCTYKIPNLSEDGKYKFRVTAFVNDEKGHALESAFKTVAASPVREMRISFTVKGTGQRLVANKFSGGVFITRSGQRVSGVRVTNERADYSRSVTYTKLSAKYFINDFVNSHKNLFNKSATKMVWVSTYTQRAYFLEKKNGKWECTDYWNCATGKPSSPTPTGVTYVKAVEKKVQRRHNVNWWSTFSSWNSLHGRVGDSMTLGQPASGGCVRNPDDRAKKIYDKVPKGYNVVVF